MNQRQIVYQYIQTQGSFIPAKERGAAWNGQLLGSQADRRCRELRKAGLITSIKSGKFEKYIPIRQENTMGDGYRQFLITGKKLFNKTPKPNGIYEDLTTEELRKRQVVAEEWLKDNKDNPKYEEALKRYESISDELIKRSLL